MDQATPMGDRADSGASRRAHRHSYSALGYGIWTSWNRRW